MLIHDFLEYYARNIPESKCVSQGGSSLSYAEVNMRANQLANGLRSLGLNKGDRVAILAENSPEHFDVFFAASKIGAVAVPLNYRLAPAELAFIINDAEVKVLVVLKGLEQTFTALQPKLSPDLTVMAQGFAGQQDYAAWRDSQDNHKPEVEIQPNDELIQLYTSGTTGNPKGVVNSQHNVVSLALMNNTSTPSRNSAGSSGIICAPLFHIGGAGSVFMAVWAGQESILHQAFNPAQVVQDMEDNPVGAVFLVPAMIGAILQIPGIESRDFSKLKQVFYGASPISETLLRSAMQVFQCDFIQMYGMTETTGTVINLSAEDHQLALASKPELLRAAGRPSVGVLAKAVTADGEEVPTGEIGEICVKSPTNMLGYYNLLEATRDTLQDGWVRTGDAGYIDEEGYIYLKDRIKDMVVSGGENIYPVEVENAIAKHPAIVDVAVIGVPDKKFGEALLAFAVLKPDHSLTSEELIEFCRDKIAGYKIPRQLEVIAEMPRNATGKILKKTLREPYWEGRARNVG